MFATSNLRLDVCSACPPWWAKTFGVERVKRRGRHAPLRRWAFSASASFFLIFLSYFRVALQTVSTRFAAVTSRSTRGQRSIDIWENPKYSLKPRSFENRAQGFLQTTQEKLPAIRFNLLHR